jgi:putative restriction endonuclease
MLTVSEDLTLREAIMNHLASRTAEAGGFLTRSELSSFPVGNDTRRLIDASRGIWNPRDLNATLSIVSSPDGPYDDRDVDGGLFRYDYRAGSTAGDNTKLRRAIELQLPIILLRKFATGAYIPIFPVYVVDDDLAKRQFVVAVDEALRFIGRPGELSEVERRYAERVTRHRLHQSMFRGMVLHAYDVKCAVCRLRHGDLLDAAHITADSEETGLAVVTNGLSLCKIHHAAYDRNLMGISPEYRVSINREMLEEVDGPMLKHGLQEMHGSALALPSNLRERPDPDRLTERYNLFLAR